MLKSVDFGDCSAGYLRLGAAHLEMLLAMSSPAPDRDREFPLRRVLQIRSRIHGIPYTARTRGSFHRDKADRASSSLLSSNAEVYNAMHLSGMVLRQESKCSNSSVSQS
jgi:hypothetical protein